LQIIFVCKKIASIWAHLQGNISVLWFVKMLQTGKETSPNKGEKLGKKRAGQRYLSYG